MRSSNRARFGSPVRSRGTPVLEVLLEGLALGYVLVEADEVAGTPCESCIRETLVRFHTACPSARA